MKITIAQFELRPGCDEHRLDGSQPPGVLENVQVAAGFITRAAEQGVELVAFGEWFVGLNAVEPLPSVLTDRFCALAREHHLTLALGGLRARSDDGTRSKQVCLVIGPSGEILGQQVKLNLYPTERPWIEAGKQLTPVDTPWGRLVVTTGLDSVDPHLYEQIRAAQPDLWVAQADDQILPEVFGSTAPDLPTLMMQRSAELGTTIAMAMILGQFREMSFNGGSLIAHQGRIVAQMGDEEGLLVAETVPVCA